MNFASDTAAPAHPRVLEALSKANEGHAASYGADALTARLREILTGLFETDDFDAWLTASGTAANALALSCFCPPTGAILCHEEAHIERDERGAPEFFTGGGKLQLLGGDHAQIDEAALREAIAAIDHGFVHGTPAHVLSLTNLTECGTVYPPSTIGHYAALAHEAGLTVHLDGARFANALVSDAVGEGGVTAAGMSWKAGVDVLTLGLTKTGAIGCEIILLFGEARAQFGALRARAKRSGHMPPKMRYLAAQGLALLDGDLWLSLARRANGKARQLANGLCRHDGVTLAHPVHGNEVFVRLPDALVDALQAAGAGFYPWPGGAYRFVCSWDTTDEDIDAVFGLLAR